MPTPDDLNRQCERSITKMGNRKALDHIGQLIDDSLDAGFERGANRALFLLDELAKRDLTNDLGALVEYFRANAWNVKTRAAGDQNSWAWEQPERQQEILALSRAATHSGFKTLDIVRRCQILTNRANLLNTGGRFIDAIAGWDATLGIMSRFAMARGNRGSGLRYYAGLLTNARQRGIFLLHAHGSLTAANAVDAFYDSPESDSARQHFKDLSDDIAVHTDLTNIQELLDLGQGSLGRSRIEQAYRRWCLDHRLFLNPINDLGPYPAAAIDDLSLPAIVESFDHRPGAFTPPPVIAFFNQIKQEYVSSRFALFEGLRDTRVHFSDRGVRLFDTLDYPLYSLATERIRMSFRVAYSLLDKVAFLVDHYWNLAKISDRITFRNVWMVEGKSRLLPQFEQYKNWPLRGLFWLSKELFDDQLKLTTSPDARELHDIRNALEHKYLQVYEGWAQPFTHLAPSATGLGLLITSDELEAKALRVMKIARSALFHLSYAIGVEERSRARDRPADHLLGPMSLTSLDDNRKRRDPL